MNLGDSNTMLSSTSTTNFETNRRTEFRKWVGEMWRKNRDELEGYRLEPYSEKEYFNRYKWWLKKLYKDRLK